MALPEYLREEAIELYGKQFLFAYPNRELTDEDRMYGMEPSGKRQHGYYCVCTKCGGVTQLDWEPELLSAPGTNIMECPLCDAEVELRKGWYGKKGLKDRFYLQAWEVLSHDEVLLHEAIVCQEDWSRSDEYGTGALNTYVYDLRTTRFVPWKCETTRWNGNKPLKRASVAPGIEQCGVLITHGQAAMTGRGVYYNITSLNESFLEPLFRPLAEAGLDPEWIAPYIITMMQEPITEFAFKAGYYHLAEERVNYHGYSFGTKHINFAAKSPKKMFRGLKKNNAEQKMKQLMKMYEQIHECTINQLESAAERFLQDPTSTADELADIISNNEVSIYKKIWDFLPMWSTKRILEYVKGTGRTALYYLDYIRAASDAERPLNEQHTAFPADLGAAHDEVNAVSVCNTSPQNTEACKKRHKKLISQGYEYRHGNICTVVPYEPKEIVLEGKNMSHCVGTYVSEHCHGETNIIFLRRPGSNTAYYTLEVEPRSQKFRQCYGYHNETTGLIEDASDGSHKITYDPEVGKFLWYYKRHLQRRKEYNRRKKQEDKRCRKTA